MCGGPWSQGELSLSFMHGHQLQLQQIHPRHRVIGMGQWQRGGEVERLERSPTRTQRAKIWAEPQYCFSQVESKKLCQLPHVLFHIGNLAALLMQVLDANPPALLFAVVQNGTEVDQRTNPAFTSFVETRSNHCRQDCPPLDSEPQTASGYVPGVRIDCTDTV